MFKLLFAFVSDFNFIHLFQLSFYKCPVTAGSTTMRAMSSPPWPKERRLNRDPKLVSHSFMTRFLFSVQDIRYRRDSLPFDCEWIALAAWIMMDSEHETFFSSLFLFFFSSIGPHDERPTDGLRIRLDLPGYNQPWQILFVSSVVIWRNRICLCDAIANLCTRTSAGQDVTSTARHTSNLISGPSVVDPFDILEHALS